MLRGDQPKKPSVPSTMLWHHTGGCISDPGADSVLRLALPGTAVRTCAV